VQVLSLTKGSSFDVEEEELGFKLTKTLASRVFQRSKVELQANEC
jgi:hypothetical protein